MKSIVALQRQFARSRSGVTSIEFAIVVPLLLAFVFGGVALSLGIWKSNIVQDVAQESARCAVSRADDCETAVPACAPAFLPNCYGVKIAAARGFRGISEGDISTNPAEVIGNSPFTTVRITVRYSLLGYSFVMSGMGAYPN